MFEIPFSYWSAILLALVAVGVYFLYRILRILKQMNNGEPSSSDMRNIEFRKMKFKE